MRAFHLYKNGFKYLTIPCNTHLYMVQGNKYTTLIVKAFGLGTYTDKLRKYTQNIRTNILKTCFSVPLYISMPS